MKCFIRMYVSFTLVLITCMMGCAQSTSDTSKDTEAIIQLLLGDETGEEQGKTAQVQHQGAEATEEQIEALKQKAEESFKAGDYKKVLEDIMKASELSISHGRVSGRLGRSLIFQGKFEEAKEACQKAHETDSFNFTFAVNLAHSYLLTGDAATARTYYEKAFSRIESEDEFNAVLADIKLFTKIGWQVEACRRELAWMTGEYDRVYRFYIEASRYWEQARELWKKEQTLEAIQFWEKSIEVEQASPEPRGAVLSSKLSALGLYYKRNGQLVKALPYYEEAVELNRKSGREDWNASYLKEIAQMYRSLMKYPEALKSYEQALEIHRKLELNYETAVILYKIGLIYRAWGPQYSNALDYFTQAWEKFDTLGKKRDSAIVLNNIGEVYRALGQYTQALEYYEEALALSRNLEQNTLTAAILNNTGMAYNGRGQYEKALEYIEQALALNRQLGQDFGVATHLNNIGYVYRARGDYTKALDHFEQARKIFHTLGRNDQLTTSLNNIGEVYLVLGQHTNALEYFEQALDLNRQLGLQADSALVLNNIAAVYHFLGQYDKTISYFEQALETFRTLGRELEIASCFNNIGGVYMTWGQYDAALDHFEQALEIFRSLDIEPKIADCLVDIGELYRKRGQYRKFGVRETAADYLQASIYLQDALELNRKLGRDTEMTTIFSSIGLIFQAMGDYDDALDYFQQALELSRQFGEEAKTALALHNIGTVFYKQGQYTKAFDYLKQALEIIRISGRTAELAAFLSNLSVLHYKRKEYSEAITYLTEAVELIENLRKTVTGDVRRDYLETVIGSYQSLLSCYVRTDDVAKAFETIEQSRAKLLAERLASSHEVDIPSLKRIQTALSEDTAVLIYANTERVDLGMVQLIITKDNVTTSELSINDFVEKIMKTHRQPIEKALSELTSVKRREFKLLIKNQEELVLPYEYTKDMVDFDKIIEFYRHAIHSTAHFRGPKKVRDERQIQRKEILQTLSQQLYQFLLGEIQEQIGGKTRLLIVPDGILNFLPFETLQDEQGRYLIESYQISYAQSLTVLESVEGQAYDPSRKALLAFGGAAYDAPPYEGELIGIENEAQLRSLRKQVELALEQSTSLRRMYASLGIDDWSPLPGTDAEVNKIGDAVEGAEILRCDDVTEATVKALSEKGSLAEYKVLHFATHGVAVPEVPELSALVLSSEEGDEDGYLRMGEIAELDIQADFVNLSACETGLGKIYSGEGVVGLTQAFLLAGAKGLSVSLWSVADESTAQFMVALYQLVEEQEMSYADALNEVKRSFIKGDFGEQWQAPYYWAPFVYYGR